MDYILDTFNDLSLQEFVNVALLVKYFCSSQSSADEKNAGQRLKAISLSPNTKVENKSVIERV
ncbi:MAG: hypothetical protein ACJ0HV_01030 [Candidatus Pseudothioglobus sp.]